MSALSRIVAAAFSPETVPPTVDTAAFMTGIKGPGQVYRYEPVFEEPTILHVDPDFKRRFIGWEKVGLRWWKPDGHGGLVQLKNNEVENERNYHAASKSWLDLMT